MAPILPFYLAGLPDILYIFNILYGTSQPTNRCSMELEFSSLWYWIILGITALVFAGLGFLFGKLQRIPAPDNLDQINILDIENAQLKADLDTCKKRLSGTRPTKEKPVAPKMVEKSVGTTAAPPLSRSHTIKAIFGGDYVIDDLKIVEGIGPKIETLFHRHGIQSWKALSECSVDRCQEVLASGGKQYRIHDPASWPMQAKMAQGGHWKQLWDWQEKHRAGKF